MIFTERSIASYLARIVFQRKYLLLVPNCSWPGSECDLLAVTPNLRVVDVEIKISRSDLKADAKKEKWFEYDSSAFGVWPRPKTRMQYPKRVWKHYYCLPRDLWMPELVAAMNPVSGILLVESRRGEMLIRVERAAKPDRNAEKISAEDAIDIARLASLRMWDAYEKLDQTERRIAA